MTTGGRDEGVREIKGRESRGEAGEGKGADYLEKPVTTHRPATLNWQEDVAG